MPRPSTDQPYRPSSPISVLATNVLDVPVMGRAITAADTVFWGRGIQTEVAITVNHSRLPWINVSDSTTNPASFIKVMKAA
jgi:hypothetical protein